MMMVFKRREVLIVALIVLIGIAGVINWNADKTPVEDDTAIVASSDAITFDDTALPSDLTAEDVYDAYDTLDFEDTIEHSAQEADTTIGEAQYVSASAANGYFAEASMSRESSRSKTIEMLTSVVDNPNTDALGKSNAQAKILEIASITDKENICENLIKAKGFEQVVVFINDDIANVTVKTIGLTATDTAKIQEIIASQTDIAIKNIKIVEVK